MEQVNNKGLHLEKLHWRVTKDHYHSDSKHFHILEK